jgi:transcriptional regulator, xre family
MKSLITLEAARINIGYSQKEASTMFGVHYQTLAKWELDNSRMPFEMIEKIPDIYKIQKEDIFFGDKNEFIRSLRNGTRN